MFIFFNFIKCSKYRIFRLDTLPKLLHDMKRRAGSHHKFTIPGCNCSTDFTINTSYD